MSFEKAYKQTGEIQSEDPMSEILLVLRSAAAALSWPWLLSYYLLRTATDGKYRAVYGSRMGLDLPQGMEAAPRIWIHALSVGEVLSVSALVSACKDLFPELDIVFSTATESGQEVARRRLHGMVGRFFILPHDFPWIMESLVRRINPQAFVLVETDLWPNLLRALKGRGVPRLLVNGRLSDRSYRRLLGFRSFVREMMGLLDVIFVQSSQDALRYEALGILRERLLCWGNLKYDAALEPLSEPDRVALRDSTGLNAGRAVWIAASTHAGEEEILLEAHRKLMDKIPGLLLILAPRQPGRCVELCSLCRAKGFKAVRRSHGAALDGASVLLLDTLGELARFFALASIAFVGGSLVPFGGHNPLEAVAQGVSVLWGPHLSNFREMEADLLQAGCGRRVASPRELQEALWEFLSDPEYCRSMREKVSGHMAARRGGSRKMARFVLDTMAAPRVDFLHSRGDTRL